MKDYEKFKGMMFAVADKFEKDISSYFTDMVWEMLKPYSDKKCVDAFNHVIINGHFWKDLMPDIKACLDGNTQENKDQLMFKSSSHMDEVLEKLRIYGSDGGPKFKDPITNYLMTVRWPFREWGRNLKEKDLVWWKKEFVKAYVEMAKGKAKSVEQLTHSESKRLLGQIVVNRADGKGN